MRGSGSSAQTHFGVLTHGARRAGLGGVPIWHVDEHGPAQMLLPFPNGQGTDSEIDQWLAQTRAVVRGNHTLTEPGAFGLRGDYHHRIMMRNSSSVPAHRQNARMGRSTNVSSRGGGGRTTVPGESSIQPLRDMVSPARDSDASSRVAMMRVPHSASDTLLSQGREAARNFPADTLPAGRHIRSRQQEQHESSQRAQATSAPSIGGEGALTAGKTDLALKKQASAKQATARKPGKAGRKKGADTVGKGQQPMLKPATEYADISIYPRRKAGQTGIGNNRPPVVITRDVLEEHFNMPLLSVCKKLVLCPVIPARRQPCCPCVACPGREAVGLCAAGVFCRLGLTVCCGVASQGLCATVLKKVCRQLGVFKWPYKETKLIARRQGRIIAASAPIPADLCDINAAVAEKSSVNPCKAGSAPASIAAGKRKRRNSGGAASGSAAAKDVTDAARDAGWKRTASTSKKQRVVASSGAGEGDAVSSYSSASMAASSRQAKTAGAPRARNARGRAQADEGIDGEAEEEEQQGHASIAHLDVVDGVLRARGHVTSSLADVEDVELATDELVEGVVEGAEEDEGVMGEEEEEEGQKVGMELGEGEESEMEESLWRHDSGLHERHAVASCRQASTNSFPHNLSSSTLTTCAMSPPDHLDTTCSERDLDVASPQHVEHEDAEQMDNAFYPCEPYAYDRRTAAAEPSMLDKMLSYDLYYMPLARGGAGAGGVGPRSGGAGGRASREGMVRQHYSVSQPMRYHGGGVTSRHHAALMRMGGPQPVPGCHGSADERSHAMARTNESGCSRPSRPLATSATCTSGQDLHALVASRQAMLEEHVRREAQVSSGSSMLDEMLDPHMAAEFNP
jgi:hypothetical protein